MKIRNLCCHRDLDIAIRCLNSLSIYLEEEFQLLIHDDGSLTESDIASIYRQVPDSAVIRRAEVDTMLDDTVLYRYPHLRKMRRALPYFLKIVDVVLVDADSVIRFVDSDVLFFRPFKDAFCSHNEYDACFMLDARSCYGFRAKDYWPLGPVKPVRRVNSGMFWIRRECLDFEWIEWVCARCGLDQVVAAKSWFEQGLWAAIAGRCKCQMFDPRQICTAEDQKAVPPAPVALHFNGPSRQIFDDYAKGQENPITDVEQIQTVPSQTYSLRKYALDAIEFRLARAFG